MPILRNKTQGNFTIVGNEILRDPDLSLKARGLLVTLLSLPDDWEFSEMGLVKILSKDGQSSLRTGLKELEAGGYLRRTRLRDEKGLLGDWLWEIFGEKQQNDEDDEDLQISPQKPTSEPKCDFPSLDNPNLDNADNKELNNKEPKYINPSILQKPIDNNNPQATERTDGRISEDVGATAPGFQECIEIAVNTNSLNDPATIIAYEQLLNTFDAETIKEAWSRRQKQAAESVSSEKYYPNFAKWLLDETKQNGAWHLCADTQKRRERRNRIRATDNSLKELVGVHERSKEEHEENARRATWMAKFSRLLVTDNSLKELVEVHKSIKEEGDETARKESWDKIVRYVNAAQIDIAG